MTGRDARPHILIMGGTEEARQLADLIFAHFGPLVRLTTSLAGHTRRPSALAGDVRTGGFGGAAGLASYLDAENVTILIDATHPFAVGISGNIDNATKMTGIPRLTLTRAIWSLPDGLDVTRIPHLTEAPHALKVLDAKRVFLTTGIQGLGAFSNVPDTYFLVRLIEAQASPLPLPSARLVVQSPPFTLDGEKALMSDHRIDTLISKESGGAATEAKLLAARDLGIRTILITRPPGATGETVSTPQEALIRVQSQLSLSTVRVSSPKAG